MRDTARQLSREPYCNSRSGVTAEHLDRTIESAERVASVTERLLLQMAQMLSVQADHVKLTRDNRDLLARIDDRLATANHLLEGFSDTLQTELTNHLDLRHRLTVVEGHARVAANWPKWVAVIAALVSALTGLVIKLLEALGRA